VDKSLAYSVVVLPVGFDVKGQREFGCSKKSGVGVMESNELATFNQAINMPEAVITKRLSSL